MSSRHDDGHELLLQELLTTDLSDPQRLDELSRCDVCAPRLEELLALREQLGAAAKEQRDVLHRLEATRSEDDLDDFGGARIVEAFLAARELESSVASSTSPTFAIEEEVLAPRRSSASRVVGALLAASLLALVGWRLFTTDAPRSPGSPDASDPLGGSGEPFLLGTEAGGLAPVGAGASFREPFRWQLPLEGWFVVHVFPALEGSGAAPGDGAGTQDDATAPLATSPRIEAQEWTWPEDATRAWPDRIRWEVRSYDAFGVVVETAEAYASR